LRRQSAGPAKPALYALSVRAVDGSWRNTGRDTDGAMPRL
jgi:hypothetical protein